MIELQEESSIRMGSTYALVPVFDGAKSFYGNAVVVEYNTHKELYSYGTFVASIHKKLGPEVFGTYSNTTLRHIKEFLKHDGFKAESKAQIEQDYMI